MIDRHDDTPASGPDNRDAGDDQWAPCAAGELQQMVARSRSTRLNRSLTKVVSVGAVCIALLGGWLLTSPRGEDPAVGNNFAGISCGEVYMQLGQYAKGTLDPATSERIREHLRRCSKCGPIYERMTGEPIAMGAGVCTDPACRQCRPNRHPHVLFAGQPDRAALNLAIR